MSLRTPRWEVMAMKEFARLPVLLVLLLAASPSAAGVVDSPLPAPFTQHVFTVPGVRSDFYLATFFACTNLDAASVTVGVEWFDDAGGGPVNDAAATSLSVGPGQTKIFGTGTGVLFTLHSDVGVGNGAGWGSARILATSKKIACTAFIADNTNAPPTSMVYLTIIKGTKQKAAN